MDFIIGSQFDSHSELFDRFLDRPNVIPLGCQSEQLATTRLLSANRLNRQLGALEANANVSIGDLSVRLHQHLADFVGTATAE